MLYVYSSFEKLAKLVMTAGVMCVFVYRMFKSLTNESSPHWYESMSVVQLTRCLFSINRVSCFCSAYLIFVFICCYKYCMNFSKKENKNVFLLQLGNRNKIQPVSTAIF